MRWGVVNEPTNVNNVIGLLDKEYMSPFWRERLERIRNWPGTRKLLDAVSIVVLIGYFLHFALPALRGGFREDEMMNIATYWRAGALKSLWANVLFWTPFYRPGGALYYLPLYHFFALDPLPYRIVQIGILAASIPIVYYFSRCLASSRSVAFLAVLALCYHPHLANLVYVGAFIYDVLCGFFYFAALAYYIRIRAKELPLRPTQLLGFLALYICALNSKEMAVTLPVMVLIYEFLKSPRWTSWKAFVYWGWHSAAPPLIAGLLTAIYIFGKTRGSSALIKLEPYRPRYSWHQFTSANAKFVGELLFAPHAVTPTILLILWILVFIYAFLRRDRTLQLMAFWIVIVPLPIAFLLPVRGGGSLYLLLFGWVIIFAKVAFDLVSLISRSSIFVGDLSPRVLRVAATILLGSTLAFFTQRENQRYAMAWLKVGAKTSHVIQALQSLNLHPAPGSSVLLLPERIPFQNQWNVFFIASLVWNDRSLRIWLEGAHKLTPQQVANMHYIISLSEFQARVVRSPEIPEYH